MKGGLRFTNDIKKNVYPNQPLVSVITVVKNGELTLKKTIQSVLSQTYKNIEYIIVDGASTDNTINIIRQYENKIDYWVSEADAGISDAFNKGINLSSGTWLNFINAGDQYINNKVIQQVSNFFEKEYVITGFAKYGIKTIPERLISNNEKLHRKAKISHQASFIKRSVLTDIGYFNKDYKIRMDYDFWLRVLKKYNFKMLNTILVNYDTHGISGQGNATRLFYQEEERANFVNEVEGQYWINLLLKLIYIKDRTKRFIYNR
jgi:glycosyltransferase involved in cell wall biosynthesis